MSKMRPRKTREQWAALIKHQEQSELTILDFCHQHDVGVASFKKWKQRLNTADSQTELPKNNPAFASVNVNSAPTPSFIEHGSATITLNMGNGMTLTIVNSGPSV